MGYSVETLYRVIEKRTVSGKSKFYPQVSNKETIWFYRCWNYYRSGIDDRLSFDTMEQAQQCIKEIKGSKIAKTIIHNQ